jgi:hypothetical protein
MSYETDRLEYLRGEIRAERISYGEIAELQELADHIQPGDVELAEWAGIPESEFAERALGGISAEGLALGHHYVQGAVNAYCPKCSEEASEAEGRDTIVLDCDYDRDK